MTPSGVPPMPICRSTVVPTRAAAIDRRHVAVADQHHPRARLAEAVDQVDIALAVEDDHRDLARLDALRLGGAAHVLGRRGVDVDDVRDLGAAHQLVHVDGRAGEEHRPALGDGDDGDRVRLTGAVRRVPSSGSTATSTWGGCPFPICSPL